MRVSPGGHSSVIPTSSAGSSCRTERLLSSVITPTYSETKGATGLRIRVSSPTSLPVGDSFVQAPRSGGLPLEALQERPGRDGRRRIEMERSLELDRDGARETKPQRLGSDPIAVTTRPPKHRYHECACTADGASRYAIRRGSDPKQSRSRVAPMNHRDRLKQLLVERSVRLGDFTLASGARSNYYIDARPTTMSAEGQVLVGHVALALVLDSGLEPTHVGGLTMGADPVAYAIAHRSALDGRPIDGFSVRKKAKEHGTGQRVEGGLTPESRCLMVEDSMTTGKSTLRAVRAVQEHGAAVVGVMTLVDRSDDATGLFAAEGLPLLSVFTGDEILEAARALG